MSSIHCCKIYQVQVLSTPSHEGYHDYIKRPTAKKKHKSVENLPMEWSAGEFFAPKFGRVPSITKLPSPHTRPGGSSSVEPTKISDGNPHRNHPPTRNSILDDECLLWPPGFWGTCDETMYAPVGIIRGTAV